MKPPPASPGPPRSSDPKPREGTETGQRSTPALVDFRVVRPKTPRGDGNQVSNGGGNLAATGRSSDPKPREGTETWDICCPPGEMLSEVVRPKTPRGDGNRMDPGELQMVREVVRPKTPRGDGNQATIAPARADDSGRQTQNPERGRKLDCANWLGADPGGRQTQNPERGRKLHIDFLDLARREDHVVRPKTPREDGNSSTIASMSMNRPGMSGDSSSWKGWGHVRWFIEEVPAGAA
ncbi:CRISPR-associated protein [Mycobacterium tuberculosis]|nr:CRISPR-associated protein [Mycobacterium tuberculosis]